MTLTNKEICWQHGFSTYQKDLSQQQKFIHKGELSELKDRGG